MQKTWENVRFKTIDGIYLRGRLYAAARRGPAIIMMPGVRESSGTLDRQLTAAV